MISQRPRRIRKPKVIWEAVEDPTPRGRKTAIEKAPRTIEKEALIPIPVEPIPTAVP